MCYGVCRTHVGCGHEKDAEIIEHCDEYGKGTCLLIPVHFKQIATPSLCLSCFRTEETKIDAMYDEKVRMIRSMIVETEAAQTERQVRGRAQRTVDPHVARLEQHLVTMKELRDEQIQLFRSEQGVWSDG